MRRGITAALLATLAGCAGNLKSTLPPAPSSTDFVGAAPATVSPQAAEAQADQLQAELEKRLASKDWGAPLQVGRTAGSFVRVRMGADESFETGTAQLQPRAMLACAGIATVLAGVPASVIHVLVHGADPGSEAATGLSARRAASMQSYLVTRGLPATRVRAEGRDAREPVSANAVDAANWRVELVIRPVVTGSGAQAWVPPPTGSCANCKPAP